MALFGRSIFSKSGTKEFSKYLEEAFILYRATKWTTSIRKTAINPIKRYGVDQAYKYAMTGKTDEGSLMENMVYMAIRRHGYEPHYTLNKQEVDFFIEEKQQLINVCYDVTNHGTKAREMNGLAEAMPIFGSKKSILVSMTEEYEEKTKNGIISIVPLDKFLLDPELYFH